jgi:hypothetical protein
MVEPFLRSSNAWAHRFMTAAIIQGAGIVGLTILVVIGQTSFMKPEVSRVIATGGAGTWFTFGYLIYLIVGVMGAAVSAIFYHLLGTKISNFFAWFHLVCLSCGHKKHYHGPPFDSRCYRAYCGCLGFKTTVLTQ